MGMRNHLIIVAAAAVFVAGCEKAIAPTVAGLGGTTANPPGNVSSSTAPLVISPATAQLRVGATFQFTTNAPTSLQSQVQWGSLESTVATVSPSGLVTAAAVGAATITARYAFDSARVATATVTVTGATTTSGTGGMSGSGVP
jgi:uncharacterized protein YjdB